MYKLITLRPGGKVIAASRIRAHWYQTVTGSYTRLDYADICMDGDYEHEGEGLADGAPSCSALAD